MLASQSNSGSTWFSGCIARACPERNFYPKEFFNPILNHRHAAALSLALGCELYQCVPNLARRLEAEDIERVMRLTWQRETYTFTKENYLGFHLHHFAKHFELAGVLCDIRSCFPPPRLRVMSWYDNWFHSLRMNQRLAPEAVAWLSQRDLGPEARALIGWQCYRWVLEAQFERLRVPVFTWEELCSLDHSALVDLFKHKGLPSGLDAATLASQVILSRRPGGAAPEHYAQWAAAFDIYNAFVWDCREAQISFTQRSQ